jgi:hypothetical protein
MISISNFLCDLVISRNQPLKSADDWCIGSLNSTRQIKIVGGLDEVKKRRRLDCVVKLGDICTYQCSKTNETHSLYSIYYELTATTCFEHYLLIFRRCCTNNNWYIACVLCRLTANRLGVERSTPTLVAASWHNTPANIPTVVYRGVPKGGLGVKLPPPQKFRRW